MSGDHTAGLESLSADPGPVAKPVGTRRGNAAGQRRRSREGRQNPPGEMSGQGGVIQKPRGAIDTMQEHGGAEVSGGTLEWSEEMIWVPSAYRSPQVGRRTNSALSILRRQAPPIVHHCL